MSTRASGLLLLLLGLSPSLAACDVDGAGGSGGLPPQTYVVSKLAFINGDGSGVIEGFDLDEIVSDDVEDDACGQIDQVDAAGRPGIDNALSELFRVVSVFVGNAIDGLIQMAVNDGTLLVVFRLEGVDDLVNDPRVEVQMLKGTGPGAPQLATTGFLAPSQTFDVDQGTPITRGDGYIEDGVLHAGPFEAVVPLKFFQVYANMRLHGARLRARIGEDGRLTEGVLGGAIEVDQVMDVVQQAAENDGTAQLLVGVAPLALMGLADLGFDGVRCAEASTALGFEAEPAFLLGDDPDQY